MSTGTPKYLLCPGYIRSKKDGQVHYVGASDLMRLYNVDPRECVIFHHKAEHNHSRMDSLIKLYPKYNGDYTLPEE